MSSMTSDVCSSASGAQGLGTLSRSRNQAFGGNRITARDTVESPQAIENTRVRRFDTWKRSECTRLGEILVGAVVAVVLPGPIGDSGHRQARGAPTSRRFGLMTGAGRFVAILVKIRLPGSPEPPEKWEKS